MLPLAIRLQRAGFRTTFAGYKWINMSLEQGTERVTRQVERAVRRNGGESLKDNSLAKWFFGPIIGQLAEDLTASDQRDPDVAAIAGDEFPVEVTKVYGVTEPNDGLVTVESAWGREAGLRLTAPTFHTGLPLSRSVARATVQFLKTGHAEIADD